MRTLLGPRLGVGFNRLWTASAVSNLGDGVTMVAGPLLLVSVTSSPALIAGGAIAGQLPWLLFGLISGAYVDRLDRRRLIIVVNLIRAVVLTVLTAAIATGHATVPLIYAVIFVLGCAETAADTAAGALLPAVVAPQHLDRANARLGATFTVINQFAAKPFGAWLYGIAAAVPFGLDALTFVIAAALVATLPLSRPAVTSETPAPRRSLRAEISEGLQWLWRHPVLRATAVAMGLSNIVFCAAFAIFVLYARDRLGLSAVGYGFLLTAFAAGGLIGSLVAVPLTRRFGATAILRADLIVESAVHATLAWTTSPWIAAGALVLFSTHGMMWGITVATLRQRVVPPHLLGRVGSVYALLESGGAAAIGSLIGGLLAGVWGLTTPFWLASAAMAAIAVGAWRPLRHATTLTNHSRYA
ncbi:MFS transporter [Actinoplanes sp. NBC_00393]|uniref:MFS transporter n=1 Tax=Actinoplanes sp. NBC_00393 TaxID=2975953 RepID=UPI002E20BB0F